MRLFKDISGAEKSGFDKASTALKTAGLVTAMLVQSADANKADVAVISTFQANGTVTFTETSIPNGASFSFNGAVKSGVADLVDDSTIGGFVNPLESFTITAGSYKLEGSGGIFTVDTFADALNIDILPEDIDLISGPGAGADFSGLNVSFADLNLTDDGYMNALNLAENGSFTFNFISPSTISTGQITSASLTSIPEPSTGVLFVAAELTALGFRHRGLTN